MTITSWKGDELKKLLAQKLETRQRAVGILLVNELKQELSKTDNIAGETPSPAPAGGPPAKVTGRLAGSVTYRLVDGVLRVGTAVLYGLFQEIGWRQGKKSVPARPWLRPVALANMDRIKQIIQGGK